MVEGVGHRERVAGWWSSYVVIGNSSFRLARKLKMLKRFGRVEVKIKKVIHEVRELEMVERKTRLVNREKVREELKRASFFGYSS